MGRTWADAQVFRQTVSTTRSIATVGDAARDAELVDAAVNGDSDAYSLLFSRHAGAVRSAVRGHIGSDYDGIQDAVQETFTRALSRIGTLRDHDRFRPWLMQIARNAAIDARRMNVKTDHELLDEAGDEGLAVAHGDLEPDLDAELRELAQVVRGAVAGLSPRDATALSMVMWLGFGPQDIGAALGITTGTAKVLLHRARRRLRDALVMQIVTASREVDCDELAACLEVDDQILTGRHLKHCPVCIEVGRRHFV